MPGFRPGQVLAGNEPRTSHPLNGHRRKAGHPAGDDGIGSAGARRIYRISGFRRPVPPDQLVPPARQVQAEGGRLRDLGLEAGPEVFQPDDVPSKASGILW